MIIVDAHLDIAYNTVCYGRDYTLPAYKKRRAEAYTLTDPGPATVGLPDALLGRVGLVFGTLFVSPAERAFSGRQTEPRYRNAREAHALALRQLDIYERLAGDNEQVRLVKSLADLDAVLATWTPETTVTKHQQGIVVLMEGADPILEPKQFEEWYERGVRIVGPAWRATRYAAGTGGSGPLTPLGFELLDVMASVNAVLDLSHMAERAYLQAVERYTGPIIASHSNPRRFCDSDRNLSDEMIHLLAERDGVVGVVLFNPFLHPTWQQGERRSTVPYSTVLDAIDYICQITGSAAHVGIGSDLDGGFGVNSVPAGIDTIMDLWWLTSGLRRRGYNEADIEAIAGGNFIRKLRQALPGSA